MTLTASSVSSGARRTGGALAALILASVAFAAEPPRILTPLPNLNDFTLFAGGGWDGNWYVGSNHAWMVRLSSVPERASYARAFVGARLGRAKLEDDVDEKGKSTGKKRKVPGRVVLALSPALDWNRATAWTLAATAAIPSEGDATIPVEDVGESRWVWTEIPLALVSTSAPNCLALWSPDPHMNGAAAAPILAAGMARSFDEIKMLPAYSVTGSAPGEAWVDESTGLARTGPSPQKPLSFYYPALALKLVPPPSGPPPVVKVAGLQEREEMKRGEHRLIRADVGGENIQEAWLEVAPAASATQSRWDPHGRALGAAPYRFTLRTGGLAPGLYLVRAAARDEWEQVGVSGGIMFRVVESGP